jgi:hypothetical protein
MSIQQPAQPLQSPVEASASARGQSYAQRLYASALAKPPQPQSTLQAQSKQFSSSTLGESDSDIPISTPGRPPRPSGARPRAVSSLMLNVPQDNISSPQPVSALDFYHSSVSKLELRRPVPNQNTSSSGLRRPPSVMSSSSRVSVPHSPHPLISQTAQAHYDMQAPSKCGPVPVFNSNVPSPSPARDYQLSNAVESRSSGPVLAGSFTSPGISSQSGALRSNAVASPPTPPGLLPREFSTITEVSSQDAARLVVISSESVTRSSHPELIRSESLELSPEDVPSYSLVDDTPPPPDFDESQSICSANALPTVYHTDSASEAPLVLSPPDAPSPSPPLHEFGVVSGAVPSTGADTPPPPNLSPDFVPEPARPSSVMQGAPSYYQEKTLVYVTEKSRGYPAEDFVPCLPEKTRSYVTKESLSSSRTPSGQVPSDRQRGSHASSNDVRRPPTHSAAKTHHVGTSSASARASSMPPPPPTAPPPTVPAVTAPAPITTPAPPPILPAASPPLSPTPAANSVNVRPVTSQPLRPGGAIQRPNPPYLSPRVVASSSSAFSPPSVSGPTGTSPQLHPAASYSPLSSLYPEHSRAPSVPSMPSTGGHPVEFQPQLSPSSVSPAWHGESQVPYQSSRQGPPSQALPPPPLQRPTRASSGPATPSTGSRPAEFQPQLVPYQSPRQGFQPQTSPSSPQHTGARSVAARSPQSSRNFGSIAAGIAGGTLGLLGGAVLAEALGGNDVVDDLAGNMAAMTSGDPTDGVMDSSMGAGDQFFGNEFDPTAGFQGGQTISEGSFVPTYDVADPGMEFGFDSNQAAGYEGFQGEQTFSEVSFTQTYDVADSNMGYGLNSNQAAGYEEFQGEQTFSEDSFVQTYNMADPNMGYNQAAGFQGQPDSYFTSEQVQQTQQIEITQTYNISQDQQQPDQQQPNQQPNDQNGGTHYLHDARKILQSACKFYQGTQQSGAPQGPQNPQATASFQQSLSANPGTSFHGKPPNSQPIGHAPMSSVGPSAGAHAGFASAPSHGTSLVHPNASYSSATQHNGQFTHATTAPTTQPSAATFSQHHPSVDHVSQHINHPLSHPHASPHVSHTQNPYINHTAYPSSGTATHTMSPHGPMQAQHVAHYGTGSPHGNSSHHPSLGSHAHGQHSMHSAPYAPHGNTHLQQSHAAQDPSNTNTVDKAALARQFVKGALLAGGVFAKYNHLSGGNGFFGNNGESS